MPVLLERRLMMIQQQVGRDFNISHQMARFHGDVTYAVVWIKMAGRDEFNVDWSRRLGVRKTLMRNVKD
jgi:hypothetical protein